MGRSRPPFHFDRVAASFKRQGLFSSSAHPKVFSGAFKPGTMRRVVVFKGNMKSLKAACARSGGFELARAIVLELGKVKPRTTGGIERRVVNSFRGKEIVFEGKKVKVNGALFRIVCRRLSRLGHIRSTVVPVK